MMLEEALAALAAGTWAWLSGRVHHLWHRGAVAVPDASDISAAAGKLGLQLTGDGAAGTVDGLEVAVGAFGVRVTTGVGVRFRGRVVSDLPSEAAVGDPSFDRVVYLEGEAEEVSAVFTQQARALLLPLLRRGATHADAELHLPDVDPAVLTVEVAGLVAAAVAMRTGPLGPALAERARHDPVPGVREHAFRRLLDVLDRGPAGCPAGTLEALVALPENDWQRVRLAVHRGEAGVRELWRLTREGDDPVRRAAAVRLAEHAGDVIGPELEDLLAGHLPSVWVAEVLTQRGTVRSVPALRAAQQGRWRRSEDDVFQRAIDAIQARVVGGAHGQVSLALSGAGGLALAPDAGNLSAPTTPDGELSAPRAPRP